MAGLASVHWFEAALTPQSTNEQRIRGNDSTIDWALLVTGYGVSSVTELVQSRLSEQQLEQRGAAGYGAGVYGVAYSLAHRGAVRVTNHARR